MAPNFVCWCFCSFNSFDSFCVKFSHCVLVCVLVTTLGAGVVYNKQKTPFQSHQAV